MSQRPIRLLALLIALAVAVGACGSDDTAETSNNTHHYRSNNPTTR